MGTVDRCALISPDSFLTSQNSASERSVPVGHPRRMRCSPVRRRTVPYFNDTRITLDRLALKNVPKDMHIVPGMAVEADIKVGERTVLEYLTERLLPVVNDGMREPN